MARYFNSRIFFADHYLTYADWNTPTSNTFTASAWILSTRAYGTGILAYGNGTTGGIRGWLMRTDYNGNLQLRYHTIYGAQAHNPGKIPLGEWIHVAFVVNARLSRCYLNGMPFGTSNTFDPIVDQNSTDDIVVGGTVPTDGSGTGGWIGALSDVAFWNAALSIDKIQALAAGASARSVDPTNLKFFAQLANSDLREDLTWVQPTMTGKVIPFPDRGPTSPILAISVSSAVPGDATPSSCAITVTAPSAAATGAATATPTSCAVTLAAPISTATGASAAAPSSCVLAVTGPSATATGAGAATPSPCIASFSAPLANAVGLAQVAATANSAAFTVSAVTATGAGVALPGSCAVSLVCPTVSASVGGVGTANPSPCVISISAPAVTATGASVTAPTSAIASFNVPIVTATGAGIVLASASSLTFTAPSVSVMGAANATATAQALALVCPVVTATGAAVVSVSSLALAFTAPPVTAGAGGMATEPYSTIDGSGRGVRDGSTRAFSIRGSAR